MQTQPTINSQCPTQIQISHACQDPKLPKTCVKFMPIPLAVVLPNSTTFSRVRNRREETKYGKANLLPLNKSL